MNKNRCRHGVDTRYATCGNCDDYDRRKLAIKTRKFIAPIVNFLVSFSKWSTWGKCPSCGISTVIIPGHPVRYNPSRGSALICESCWGDLYLDQRIEIYKKFWKEHWVEYHEWNEIEKAIRFPHHWEYPDDYCSIEVVP